MPTQVKNVLVFCHGMVPSQQPKAHTSEYQEIFKQLTLVKPELSKQIDEQVYIEYGQALSTAACMKLRPDERLSEAQNFVLQQIAYDNIRTNPSQWDQLLKPIQELFPSVLLFRGPIITIRDSVFTLGLADATYYCSEDGETAIRHAVYSKVLEHLEKYKRSKEIRLHVIAHSLGAAVMFDFLFGLFAADSYYQTQGGKPDYVLQNRAKDSGYQDSATAYNFWRQRACREDQQGKLVLASFTIAGAQLPLFLMRKQAVVNTLCQKKLLDPEVIGVSKTRDTPAWKIFYDVDDLLGYPTMGLFEHSGAIRQYQVNTHWNPVDAHVTYWQNNTVLQETATLICGNANPTEKVGLQ